MTLLFQSNEEHSLLSYIDDSSEMQDNNFDDSLLGVMESNMAHDAVYFNCFPNLELSYTDDILSTKP